jgi:hypothetical protein
VPISLATSSDNMAARPRETTPAGVEDISRRLRPKADIAGF